MIAAENDILIKLSKFEFVREKEALHLLQGAEPLTDREKLEVIKKFLLTLGYNNIVVALGV